MVKVFIATGYNSYTHKNMARAFLEPSKAESFLEGLTNPKFNTFTANSYIDLLNIFLTEGDKWIM